MTSLGEEIKDESGAPREEFVTIQPREVTR
jgi:hypothetical protein